MESARRLLCKPESEGNFWLWEEDEVLLEFVESDEQYLETLRPGEGRLYYHEDASDEALVRLIKPWWQKQRRREKPDRLDRAAELVMDLVGPLSAKRIGRDKGMGADTVVIRCAPKGYGETLHLRKSHRYHRGNGKTFFVGPFQEGWRAKILSWLQRRKEEMTRYVATPAQIDAILDAIERTGFEPVFAEMHDARRLVGLRGHCRDGEPLEVTLKLQEDDNRSALGYWTHSPETIALFPQRIRRFRTGEVNVQDRFKMLQVTLHEIGHAVHRHVNSDSGFTPEYDWVHELQAEQFVMEHAKSREEARAFEAFALRNLQAKHQKGRRKSPGGR